MLNFALKICCLVLGLCLYAQAQKAIMNSNVTAQEVLFSSEGRYRTFFDSNLYSFDYPTGNNETAKGGS